MNQTAYDFEECIFISSKESQGERGERKIEKQRERDWINISDHTPASATTLPWDAHRGGGGEQPYWSR